ncbi:MFS general substrate transporter [Aspergillus heteromorphus CBS 117.55]|uniref:MFS general substrate transporter n=1 Tax=Aspergillus heteromorphus CBS 117.55 TaxID=1448321 RepID=A0A317W3V9_9EURO|nr:MFS general substrate transporter [Aspergillus heteromorphus CBS 117.55]PWY80629.1 MFS general substrate transporter [Aspergillus heteromorphus CBS 117.55]
MADNTPIDIIHSREFDETPDLDPLYQIDDQQEPAPKDTEIKHGHDVLPDGGYGWSYGVFLSYYLSSNVFPNTSALSYAFTGGLSISCALLVAPLATHLIHLCGTRTVLNLGVFFETLSLIGSSFATQRWHIFLSQGVCFGWGMGFLFVGSVGITPQWFHRCRSLAMGINAAGSGIGGLIYSLAVGAMIPRLGLSWAFRILGIISFVVNLVCANLMRDRNHDIGSKYHAFAFPLFKRPEFLLFLGWGVFSMLGYVALLFSVANFSLSVGLTSHQGSIVSALLNLGQGLGRPIVGMFSDKLGRINIATFLTFLCGLFCLVIWTFARSLGVVLFFAILVGTVAGTYWATVTPVLAEIIGLRDLPSGLSVTWLVLVPPTTVSEAIALVLRDNGSKNLVYLKVQIFTGFMYIGGAVCLWLVRGWKIGDLARRQELSAVMPPNNKEDESPEQLGEKYHAPNGTTPPGTREAKKFELWSPTHLLRSMVASKKV